jgi:hypothetical protein
VPSGPFTEAVLPAVLGFFYKNVYELLTWFRRMRKFRASQGDELTGNELASAKQQTCDSDESPADAQR